MQICKEIKKCKKHKSTKNWTQSLDAAIALVLLFSCLKSYNLNVSMTINKFNIIQTWIWNKE